MPRSISCLFLSLRQSSIILHFFQDFTAVFQHYVFFLTTIYTFLIRPLGRFKILLTSEFALALECTGAACLMNLITGKQASGMFWMTARPAILLSLANFLILLLCFLQSAKLTYTCMLILLPTITKEISDRCNLYGFQAWASFSCKTNR
jgi:hypothetical protein